MSRLLTSRGQSTGASASASVFPVNIQGSFPLRLVGSPCSPRDSQESSPAPQLESINSSVLSLLKGPTLTSIHDYWKNHSFGCMDLMLPITNLFTLYQSNGHKLYQLLQFAFPSVTT